MEEKRDARIRGSAGIAVCLLGVLVFISLGTPVTRAVQLSLGTGLQFSLGTVSNAPIQLAWNPSPDPAVAGYRLYWGTASGSYSFVYDAGSATSAVVSNLAPGGVYFFAATDYDTNGLESDFSTEVSFTNNPATAPVVPQITNFVKNADGNFSINSTTAPGQSYVLLATTNFAPQATWLPIATNTADNLGSLNLVDLEATAAFLPHNHHAMKLGACCATAP
jgi:hypothetical protein